MLNSHFRNAVVFDAGAWTCVALILAGVTIFIGCSGRAITESPFVIRADQEQVIGKMVGAGVPPLGGCRLKNAKIQIDSIKLSYQCGGSDRLALVELKHPSKGEGALALTQRFALFAGEPEPPQSLVKALLGSIHEGEGRFEWTEIERGGGGGGGPPFYNEVASFYGSSLIPWLILLVLTCLWLLRLRWRQIEKHDWYAALGFFLAALVLRFAVPWVPANWYSDFSRQALEIPGFYGRNGFLNVSLLQFFLYLVPGSDTSVFFFNAIAGSISALLLYASLRLLGRTWRFSCISAGFVAVSPLYVRLSGTETPHVLIFLCWCLALLALATWIRSRCFMALPVIAGCILLASPVRADLHAGFWVLPLFLFWSRSSLLEKWRSDLPALFVLVGSTLLAGFLVLSTNLSGNPMDGHPSFLTVGWSSPEFGPVAKSVFLKVLQVLSLLPINVYAPWLPVFLIASYWVGLVSWIVTRNYRMLVWTGATITVASLPYLASNFGGDAGSLTIARYIMITATFWVLPAAQGADWAIERIAVVFRVRQRLACLLVGASFLVLLALTGGLQSYARTYFFQQEYSFLAESLPTRGTVFTVWGPKVDGVSDLNCCLAHPHLLLHAVRPDLRWIVLDPDDREAPQKVVAAFEGEGPFYWYDGPLGRMEVSDILSAEANAKMEQYLARARRFDRFLSELPRKSLYAEGRLTSDVCEQLSMLKFADPASAVVMRIHELEPTAPLFAN